MLFSHWRKLSQQKSSTIWLAVILLAGLLWMARFWHSPSFGLYEDDYTRIPQALGMAAPQLLDQVIYSFRIFADHGKPLHPSLIYSLSFLGAKLGGLRGVYGMGFLLVALNATLFFSLLRSWVGRTFAWMGVLAYCLYSADTTQAFLTHALGLQPSMTFFLLAAHAYRAQRKYLVYPLALLVLLTYETPFPLFFALPLLDEQWDRNFFKRLNLNAVILLAILVGDILFRSWMGESRVVELTFPQILLTPLQHMLAGPFVSLGTYLYRPLQALQGIDAQIARVVAIAFGVFFVLFAKLPLQGLEEVGEYCAAIRGRGLRHWLFGLRKAAGRVEVPDGLRRGCQAFLAGWALLVLAYPLTFTVRAQAISGRDTRVHFAGVVGAALIVGGVCTFVLVISARYRRKLLGSLVLAALFATLLGYGFVVQRDYTDAWRLQREFWAGVVPLLPDVEDGSVIMVEPQAFEDTLQIGANVWNTPRVLELLYSFPPQWDKPPRLYRLNSGWQNLIVVEDTLLKLDRDTTLAPEPLYTTVESDQVIFIQDRQGRLMRRVDPLDIDDLEYPVRQAGKLGSPPYEKTALYELLIPEAP